MTKYVLSIVVDNNPNVMARVSSMFARRRFNMTSVTAAQTSDPNVSIITIVTEGDAHVLDQAIKQTYKLQEVRSITLLPRNESLLSEIIMLRLAFDEKNISFLENPDFTFEGPSLVEKIQNKIAPVISVVDFLMEQTATQMADAERKYRNHKKDQ